MMILYPLERAMEFLFSLSQHIFKSHIALSILSLGVLVSLITLPLYAVAEKWRQVEENARKAFTPRLKRIKETFTGDERYMMTAVLYRESHYHPIMGLRSSVGLLIMVPFFMAAYRFLCSLTALQGKSFPFIRDLSKPDALFHIGAFPVNVLPILMTAMNVIAGAIYTRGKERRERVQIFALAAVFLVILYSSPAGLVVYWTVNNIFSLVKNIFYRIKRPIRALYICLASAVCMIDIYLVFIHRGSIKKRILMALILSLVLAAPIALWAAKRLVNKYLMPLVNNGKASAALFALSCLSLAALIGGALPSLVISSSVVEFFDVDGSGSPITFINASMLQATGLFVFWPLGIYILFGRKVRSLFAAASIVCALAAAANAFVFTAHYGTLTRLMTFSDNIAGATSLSSIILSALAFAAIAAAVIFAVRYRMVNVLSSAAAILLIGTGIATILCYRYVNKEYNRIAASKSAKQKGEKASGEHPPASDAASKDSPQAGCAASMEGSGGSNSSNSSNSSGNLGGSQGLESGDGEGVESVLHFTRKGRNVVLFMLDRAESAYFADILSRYSSAASALDGFVYYPNTVSYGGCTIFGAPPVYGGYEYTPLEINKRSDTPLVTKNNEALLMLPRLFSEEAHFDATVTDLSWANYSWIPDTSICEPYPAIRPLALERTYAAQWMAEHPDIVEPFILSRTIRRNLIYVSIFRCMPPLLREPFYDEGRWWSGGKTGDDVNEFIDYYSALAYLPQLTAPDAEGDQYFTIVNETTHQRCPSVIAKYIGQRNKNIASNALSIMAIAHWLNALKEMGTYDNTRIIIVADHGSGNADRTPIDGTNYRADNLRPLFIYKDFDAHGALQVDSTFMTNADTPSMLLQGIVENPINPFTGKSVDSKMKAQGVVVTINKNWTPGKHGRTKYNIQNDQWYKVVNLQQHKYEKYIVK